MLINEWEIHHVKKVCLSLEYHLKFYFMFYFNSKCVFEHFKMQAYLNLGGVWTTIGSDMSHMQWIIGYDL